LLPEEYESWENNDVLAYLCAGECVAVKFYMSPVHGVGAKL
jgi:hypothetical protein